ncbi:IS3 family transposase [Fuchsiella alkaliacetigena]|uniref:IS3 family transposase n=1 Tax=Fuchsiella alkaliacetigena TaxID=957042 RepID=UPI0024A83319|nr:IS3 family transposase [Fuchsiella alkaliacetigena]
MAGLNITDKVKAINQLKVDYSITELCKTFNIARSTYYYRLNNASSKNNNSSKKLYSGHPVYDQAGNVVAEKEVIELIKEHCREHPYIGYRMMTDYLRFKHGLKVNHKRVYRIMDVLDLLQDKVTPKPDNYQLKQKRELTAPNQLWEMDMVQMYLDKSGRWVYMFDIIDVYTREIVGHHVGLRCRTDEALKALKKAVNSRDIDNLVLRTDNGTQFRSNDFQNYISETNIEHERIAVNTPEQNSHIESFHGTLKREEVYQTHYRHIAHCKGSIDEFVARYNQERPHSSISGVPPAYYHSQLVNELIDGVKLVA